MGREKSCLICSKPELLKVVDEMLERKIKMVDIAQAAGCGKSTIGRHSKEHFEKTQLAKRAASLSGGSKRQFNPAVNRIVYFYPHSKELFALNDSQDEFWRFTTSRVDLQESDLTANDWIMEILYAPPPPPHEPIVLPELESLETE